MWFNMAKNKNKKSFKVVFIPSEGAEMTLAKTENFGFACDIAKFFDADFTKKKYPLYSIEVR